MAVEQRGKHIVDILNNGTDIKIYSSVSRIEGQSYTDRFEGKFASYDLAENSLTSDRRVYGLFGKAYEYSMWAQAIFAFLLAIKTMTDFVSVDEFSNDFAATTGLFFLAVVSAFAHDVTLDKFETTKNNITAVKEVKETKASHYRNTFDI